MKRTIFVFIFFLLATPVLAQEVDVNSGQVPVIDKSVCEKPKSDGGWGGTCKYGGLTGFVEGFNFFRNPSDACDNTWPGNTEEFVGVCDLIDGAQATRGDCCIPKGTGPDVSNPQTASKLYSQYIFSEAQCNLIEGSCIDVPDAANILTGGIIPVGSVDCGTGNVKAGLCTDAGGDWKNFCCVPQNGQYCKQLANVSGSDVCSVSGVSETATPLEYGDYQLLEQIPGSSNTSGKLQPYLESLYRAGFVLIVIGAIFMIGFGGFTYMASAGNTSMIKKGKGMIFDAIIGLVVALLIWLILNIINPDLVNLTIDPLPGVSFDPAGTGANIAAGGTGDRCTAIPEDKLTTIDGYQMLKTTGANFIAMREAAASAGVTLELRSGYRSPQRQLEIWNQYGCSLQSGKAVCSGGKLVAVPCALGGGGSNHSTGDAIDINVGCGNGVTNCNTKTYNWLKANGGKFGFFNNLPKDPPHWSATGK